jgi:hypothetical protein
MALQNGRSIVHFPIALLTSQRKYGFSYVDNCPATPEASEALLLRIAFIRHTHYGTAPSAVFCSTQQR